MYARTATLRGQQRAIDEAITFVRDEWLPSTTGLAGCSGMSMLAGRPIQRAALAERALGIGRVNGEQAEGLVTYIRTFDARPSVAVAGPPGDFEERWRALDTGRRTDREDWYYRWMLAARRR